MAKDKIIEYVKDFLQSCPLIEGEHVKVDYIGTEMSYSIDKLPCDPIIQRYMDGGAKKQYQFAFMSKEAYDEDVRIGIENSGFYEAFEEWLEEQSFSDALPDMSEGKIPIRFETLNSGYLYDVDGNLAKYRVECRLIYEQEV